MDVQETKELIKAGGFTARTPRGPVDVLTDLIDYGDWSLGLHHLQGLRRYQ